MDMPNRSAIVVKTKQPFLDWLHAVDRTSLHLMLGDLLREPTIYLIPEGDTDARIPRLGPAAGVTRSSVKWFDYQHHSMLVDLWK